jgi:hypothetical protein
VRSLVTDHIIYVRETKVEDGVREERRRRSAGDTAQPSADQIHPLSIIIPSL